MNVFITGAAGGLGRVLAAECCSRGYNVFLTDINATGLSGIRRGLERQYSGNVLTNACDLTSAQSVDELLAAIDRQGLRFDMLLNIAGMDYEGEFTGRSREDIVRIVALNNAAALRITHAVLARRSPQGRFTIVFVSSLASMFPMPLKATYAASKRFLLDFALSLRQELKCKNGNVLAFCPGGMVTTREAMEGIAAQGFWGDMTTNALEVIARRLLNRALKGKALYIPGGFNKTLCLLGKIVPRPWIAAAVYQRWTQTQRKWLETDA